MYPAPKALVVAPPPLAALPDPWFQGMFEGGREKTAEIARLYRALANFMKVDFFDAGSVISTDGVDGIHFTATNNADLGTALAGKVVDVFEPAAKTIDSFDKAELVTALGPARRDDLTM